jgi:hypothetical protein
VRFTCLVLGDSLFIVGSPAVAGNGEQQKVDPIFVVGVIRDGNFIYRKAYGMASLELGVPLSPPSVFYMDSVAKQFTPPPSCWLPNKASFRTEMRITGSTNYVCL